MFVSLVSLHFVHRTDDVFVLESKWDKDKAKVEYEHGESHRFGHLPIKEEDREENQTQHAEKNGYWANHSLGIHRHRLLKHHRVEKPRKWQPEKNNNKKML